METAQRADLFTIVLAHIFSTVRIWFFNLKKNLFLFVFMQHFPESRSRCSRRHHEKLRRLQKDAEITLGIRLRQKMFEIIYQKLWRRNTQSVNTLWSQHPRIDF